MHHLRLAYVTQFLIALIAVFVLWSQAGGQSHLDALPWFVKLGLGAGASFAVVQATAAAVSRDPAWNGETLKWCAILLALLVGCGMASYYSHTYLEDDEPAGEETLTSAVTPPCYVKNHEKTGGPRAAGEPGFPIRVGRPGA